MAQAAGLHFTMDLPQLGATVRRQRQDRGITVEQLAKWCGISAGDLTLLEDGQLPQPSLPVIAQLADALGYPSALALLTDRPETHAPSETADAAEQFLRQDRSD